MSHYADFIEFCLHACYGHYAGETCTHGFISRVNITIYILLAVIRITIFIFYQPLASRPLAT